MAGRFIVECAWCGSTILTDPAATADRARVSHGVCVDCLGGLLDVPVTDMHALDADDVDRLPFGFLELTRMGVVRRYNAAEAQLSGLDPNRVIGRDFFREVAPCTQATEFEDRWRELLRQGGGDADFEFIFKFSSGHRLVRIRMIVSCDGGRNLILVQDLDQEGGASDAALRNARMSAAG